MISKLPRWVWFGAWALAFAGGFINVIGLLGFTRQAVSHLTGTTSLLAAAVASLDGAGALHFAAVIGSFVLGCIISGFVIKDGALQIGHRYGVVLIVESALLCLAVPLLKRGNVAGVYSAACACGLQNAMISTYSGTVVRTTHLSGMFTDLGIFLGHKLRGLQVEPLRLRLCILIISAFFCGGVAGAGLFHHLSYSALYLPAGLAASGAFLCGFYRMWQKTRN
jgi:uncharacterized membrane protein YoaK (UPF0700 family)